MTAIDELREMVGRKASDDHYTAGALVSAMKRVGAAMCSTTRANESLTWTPNSNLGTEPVIDSSGRLDDLREMVERMIKHEADPYTSGALIAVLRCIDDVEHKHSQEDDHGTV